MEEGVEQLKVTDNATKARIPERLVEDPMAEAIQDVSGEIGARALKDTEVRPSEAAHEMNPRLVTYKAHYDRWSAALRAQYP